MASMAINPFSSRSPTTLTPHCRSLVMPVSSPELPSPSQLFAGTLAGSLKNLETPTIPPNAVVEAGGRPTLLSNKPCFNDMKTDLREPKGPKKGDNSQVKQPKESTLKAKRCPSIDQDEMKTSTGDSISRKDVERAKNENLDKTKRQKRSAKKSGASVERQTKIRKAKITKPCSERVMAKNKEADNSRKRRKVTEGSSMTSLPGVDDSKLSYMNESSLNLEEAVKRRVDWTPVKDTKNPQSHPPKGQTLSASPCREEDTSRHAILGHLLGDYGFSLSTARIPAASQAIAPSSSKGIIKGKRIEPLLELKAPLVTEKSRRSKSPKKKPRTITEKATAPFIPAEHEGSASLLQYINPLSRSEVNCDSVGTSKITFTPKKAPEPKKPPAQKKRKDEVTFLHSPETAVKRARDQDFIFGTSSQLERDESPTFLRELQQAMKESEELKALIDPRTKNDYLKSTQYDIQKTSNPLNRNQTRNLWTAASRDLEEELLHAEIVDLTHTPNSSKPLPVSQDDHAQSLDRQDQECLDHIGRGEDACDPKPSAPNRHSVRANQNSPSSHSEDDSEKIPRFRSPPIHGKRAGSIALEMPNYKGYSEAQLKKAIISNGFKPIKKREAAIALLERCWESQRNIALRERPEAINHALPLKPSFAYEVEAKAPSPVKKAEQAKPTEGKVQATDTPDVSPKRPRGRPKKDTSIMLSPPRAKAKVRRRAISVTSEKRVDELAIPKASQHDKCYLIETLERSTSDPAEFVSTVPPKRMKSKVADPGLLDIITNLVTTCPPTNNVKNLTWYEKMLMYEPIVIEDLTGWLNGASKGEIASNKDGFELVKAWCEARSVCCLWKENLRGGQRGRW